MNTHLYISYNEEKKKPYKHVDYILHIHKQEGGFTLAVQLMYGSPRGIRPMTYTIQQENKTQK